MVDMFYVFFKCPNYIRFLKKASREVEKRERQAKQTNKQTEIERKTDKERKR
jgi:hypothetical protein